MDGLEAHPQAGVVLALTGLRRTVGGDCAADGPTDSPTDGPADRATDRAANGPTNGAADRAANSSRLLPSPNTFDFAEFHWLVLSVEFVSRTV